MRTKRLDPDRVAFPDPEEARADGLLAVGGDLAPERLIAAYERGIFPWSTSARGPRWYSPDPRAVLRPRDVHVSASLRRRLRSGLVVTADADFGAVIAACAGPRRGLRGTWITPAMMAAYVSLHELGLAHSVEVRDGRSLAGGLYGVSLGGAFFGESMFSRRPDASKVAFVTLCRTLAAWDFDFVDCQLMTPHLERMGARPMRRAEYLQRLAATLARPTRRGAWVLEPTAGVEPATC